jgi:hypothetical protein
MPCDVIHDVLCVSSITGHSLWCIANVIKTGAYHMSSIVGRTLWCSILIHSRGNCVSPIDPQLHVEHNKGAYHMWFTISHIMSCRPTVEHILWCLSMRHPHCSPPVKAELLLYLVLSMQMRIFWHLQKRKKNACIYLELWRLSGSAPDIKAAVPGSNPLLSHSTTNLEHSRVGCQLK